MEKYTFEGASLTGQFALHVKDVYDLTWKLENRTADLYRVLFSSIATSLKAVQSKANEKTGFIYKDNNNNFKIGAIMTYIPGTEEADDGGSFNLEFTFNEADMEGMNNLIDNHADTFIRISGNEAMAIMKAGFVSVEYAYNLFEGCIDVLVSWLDRLEEGSEGKEIELAGIFTASCVIEDGKKVMSIVPGEVIKQIIKADSVI